MNHIDKQILRIAGPSILSNITVPLLGLIDVAIVGHLGNAAYIGAIAVGSMLFNTVYWIFGFLRMGTSGLTSQAYGGHHYHEALRLLIRAVSIGWTLALAFIVLQTPLKDLAFFLVPCTNEVQESASLYFDICIWGAPATLGLYGFTGWFIGMQNAKIPLYIAITQNVVNILASLTLVFGLQMKVDGVALGTLIAQYAGLLMAAFLWKKNYGQQFISLLKTTVHDKLLWQREAMLRFFKVNRDIFFRTLCLVSVTLSFTAAGAAQGDITLAVNTLLLQLFTIFSYIMDGFAFAGEALGGKYYGASDAINFYAATKRLFSWGISVAVVFTLAYLLGGDYFLALLTNDSEVLLHTQEFFAWAVLIPLTSFTAFVWDGIYIGTTYTKGMLISMFFACLSFFIVYYAFHNQLGNHALWLAFIVYLSMRGAVQTLLSKQIHKMFASR